MSHTVNQYQILIKRGTSNVGTLALEYEIPVYQAIHGEDAVTFQTDANGDPVVYAEVPAEADAAVALASLHRKFGKKGTDILDRLYAGPAAFAQLSGIPLKARPVGAFKDPGEKQSEQKDRKRDAQLKAQAEKKAAKAKPEPLSLNRTKEGAGA